MIDQDHRSIGRFISVCLRIGRGFSQAGVPLLSSSSLHLGEGPITPFTVLHTGFLRRFRDPIQVPGI